jgi:hypothetical protein
MSQLEVKGAVPCTAIQVEQIINQALRVNTNNISNSSSQNNNDSAADHTIAFGASSNKAPPQYFWASDGKFHPCPYGFFADTMSLEMIKLWDFW